LMSVKFIMGVGPFMWIVTFVLPLSGFHEPSITLHPINTGVSVCEPAVY
jgi:hypothetical protein